MSNSSNRDAALTLASMGIRVFPCTPDKKPTVSAWEQNATNSALKIEAWWQSSPHLIPAIPAGAHRWIVFDLDRKNGRDGVSAFVDLCISLGIDLTQTLVVETPSGGIHVYFHTDIAFGNSRGSLPDGIDIRSLGGLVIAPGATLPDGRAYKVIQGGFDSITELPASLAVLLRPKVQVSAPTTPAAGTEATERERAYAQSALDDEVDKLSTMREGEGRNAALNTAAHSIGTMVGAGWIDRATVEQAVWEAVERNGYRAKDGNAAAWNTLQSGLSSGIAKPRDPLPAAPDIDLSGMVDNSIAAIQAKHSSAPAQSIKPESIGSEAYIGIIGELVTAVRADISADMDGLLLALIVILGSLIGDGPSLDLGGKEHHANLFCALIGKTAVGGKGVITTIAKRIALMIDPSFTNRTISGVGSSEGVIKKIRDAKHEDSESENVTISDSQGNRVNISQSKSRCLDPGVSDKRLVWIAEEMSALFSKRQIKGSVLTTTMLEMYDSAPLFNAVKNDPMQVLKPHISFIGNATPERVTDMITLLDQADGLVNRLLFAYVEMSKRRSYKQRVNWPKVALVTERAKLMVEWAHRQGAMIFADDAGEKFDEVLNDPSKDELTARISDNLARISMIYALADGCTVIQTHHLNAASEVVRYCVDSVHNIFRNAQPKISKEDRLIAKLAIHVEGLSRTFLKRELFSHDTSEQVDKLRNKLIKLHKIKTESINGTEIWFAA